MTSNCLLKQSLVKETTFLPKVGCEFSRHSSPCPSWVGEGGKQSLDRAGHGNTGLCFSPQACCVPYHRRTAICFKEIGKVFVKPVTQPIMAEGCTKAWLQPGLGCIFLCHLGNGLQRRQNKSWPPLKPTGVSEGCPVSKLLASSSWTAPGFCFSQAARPSPTLLLCECVLF